MKWMIASDLHGSYYYAQQLQQAFEREQADRLLFLGDLLYHGPRNDLPRDYAPKQVIPLLNSLAPKLLCVRGNCDAEVDIRFLKIRGHLGQNLSIRNSHIYRKFKFFKNRVTNESSGFLGRDVVRRNGRIVHITFIDADLFDVGATGGIRFRKRKHSDRFLHAANGYQCRV